MNEGESPDDAGEDGLERDSTERETAPDRPDADDDTDRGVEGDPRRDEDGSDGDGEGPPTDGVVEGDESGAEPTGNGVAPDERRRDEEGDAGQDERDAADPAAEVEAAVREVMGPDALEGSGVRHGDDEPGSEDGSGSDGADSAVEDGADGEGDEGGDDRASDGTDGSDGDGTDGTDADGTDGDGAGPAANGETAVDEAAAAPEERDAAGEPREDVPADVRKYDRFKKIDGGTYERANEFLRDRTYITAREWAMARLCADFRTETGVEMTKIGENLPELVPFMTDTYTPQAVNQARAAFEEKVRKAGATFLYGAMCDFFTAEELDDVMYEATEVAKFLLEVEGVELSVDEELAAEDRISGVMRDVREHSAALRHDECPNCGHEFQGDE